MGASGKRLVFAMWNYRVRQLEVWVMENFVS
jgi:hypothetical protein